MSTRSTAYITHEPSLYHPSIGVENLPCGVCLSPLQSSSDTLSIIRGDVSINTSHGCMGYKDEKWICYDPWGTQYNTEQDEENGNFLLSFDITFYLFS